MDTKMLESAIQDAREAKKAVPKKEVELLVALRRFVAAGEAVLAVNEQAEARAEKAAPEPEEAATAVVVEEPTTRSATLAGSEDE